MAASELRQRKSTAASAKASGKSKEPKEAIIDTSAGHLGITLSNGKIDGVELTELDEADLVFKSGLRAGDVIKSINGTAVNTHEQAMKAFDDAMGTTVTLGYAVAKDVQREIKANAAARRARMCSIFVSVIKFTFVAILLAFAAGGAAYKYAPQEMFQDYVDYELLPKLGLRAAPQRGLDGKPMLRPLTPKDPTKPWTVPGWDRTKEDNAYKVLESSYLWKNMWGKADENIRESERVNHIMDQIRASGGELLKTIISMDKEMEQYEAMAKQRYGYGDDAGDKND